MDVNKNDLGYQHFALQLGTWEAKWAVLQDTDTVQDIVYVFRTNVSQIVGEFSDQNTV